MSVRRGVAPTTGDYMQIVLNQGQVSDLFFNYEHPTYASLYGEKLDAPSEDMVLEAIKKDAVEFAECYPSDEPHNDMVEWLVKDFMKRR